ncbi:MAG TPA: RNA polymerase sigma-70 factor [Chitinophagaceae bacterium]|nr:RNA polymerase sigma-70 factor [Chitinophagaceae bacterium]
MEIDDQSLNTLLAKKDEAAFEQVFKTYFKNLHAYACTILKDEDEAEEMVQQVFFKLWERAENLSFNGPIAAYLYRAIHNECLNYLKHQKVRSNHQLYVAHSMKNQADHAQGKVMGKELEARYKKALEELPEQCRLIFQLSRFADMKYREIADELDISVKTVENQMGKALKLLRQKLVEFLSVLFLFLNI